MIKNVYLEDYLKIHYKFGKRLDNIIWDYSNNQNNGILIGDYKVQKAAENIPLIRDSVIDLPFIETEEDGAF